jgi:hypothetical protein
MSTEMSAPICIVVVFLANLWKLYGLFFYCCKKSLKSLFIRAGSESWMLWNQSADFFNYFYERADLLLPGIDRILLTK